MLQFAELGMLLPGDAASDGDYAFDIGIEQTFAQNALPDHAGCAEQKTLHFFIIRPCSVFVSLQPPQERSSIRRRVRVRFVWRKMTTC